MVASLRGGHRYRRIAGITVAVLSALVGVGTAIHLAGHGVAALPGLACVAALYASLTQLLTHAATFLFATTHRCPHPRCRYLIRLAAPTAIESRRWQEIAASHPEHSHQR